MTESYRAPLDVAVIYQRLKEKYPLVLTNTFSLKNGKEDYGVDLLILCGESTAGEFQLYDNGLNIVFDVDKIDGTYVHWHPSDFEDAISDVALFMQGYCKY